MSRIINIGAAQMGPIAKNETKQSVVNRLISHLENAYKRGCDLVVFPELTLTTFFPRYFEEDIEKMDCYFEKEMPNTDVMPLFKRAKELNIGFYLGYAELTIENGVKRRFNTSITVDKNGDIIGKYRKIHLPGHKDFEEYRAFQHLEKRYFERGEEFKTFQGFDGTLGMAICNDRRWSETYRCLALQGAELIMIGYNTPVHNPPAPEHDNLSNFHNNLVFSSGAYQNGTWVVGVAKAGNEEGIEMIGQSQIVAPSGETVAMCTTLGDELITASCDLDLCNSYKNTLFNFDKHRIPSAYNILTK